MPTDFHETVKNAQVLLPVAAFKDFIAETITSAINARNEKDLQEKFLSPEEACKLFVPAITKPTLESYSKKRLIEKYHLGGRTWYKYSELLQAVKEIKRFSHNNDLLK